MADKLAGGTFRVCTASYAELGVGAVPAPLLRGPYMEWEAPDSPYRTQVRISGGKQADAGGSYSTKSVSFLATHLTVIGTFRGLPLSLQPIENETFRRSREEKKSCREKCLFRDTDGQMAQPKQGHPLQ